MQIDRDHHIATPPAARGRRGRRPGRAATPERGLSPDSGSQGAVYAAWPRRCKALGSFFVASMARWAFTLTLCQGVTDRGQRH